MNSIRNTYFFMAIICLFVSAVNAESDCESCGGCRKFDIGPTFAQVDVLEHGKTERTMNLWGFKADLNYVFSNGFAVKPSVLYVTGDGYLASGGGGIGWYYPFNDTFTMGPFIGVTYSYVKTKTDLPAFFLEDIEEQFQSICGWAAIEAIWCFAPTWRVICCYQYGFCKTRTKLEVLPKKIKGHSKGPNYGVMLEKDFTDNWSVNLGIGYNISLSKEKHGLRGKGVKLGVAYWF